MTGNKRNMTGNKRNMTGNNQALVVTTSHRGVFFGYGAVTTDKIIRLEQVRMCIYWSAGVKGVLGLAVTGPKSDCKIGPAIPAMTIQDVTSIMECTSEAMDAWEKAPWR